MTPAIDLLKKHKIPFVLHTYEHDPNNPHFGDEAAEKLGIDPKQSFKTLLVAENGDQKKLACFVLPTANMLNLKKQQKPSVLKKWIWQIKRLHKKAQDIYWAGSVH